MPKSKRERLITLAKTQKKGKALKQQLLDSVRDATDMYPYLYIIQVQNERNILMKQVRETWSSSKFFFGKNKVMWHALGRTADSAYRPGLDSLAMHITGKRGLFATASAPEEVLEYFNTFAEPEFARAGVVASRTVELKAGVLEGQPFAIEPVFRQLGLQTKLDKGKVVLLKDTFICKEGETLSPEQCRLLKLFGEKTADFAIRIVGFWHDGKYTQLIEETEDEENDEDDDGIEETVEEIEV
jgi:mRNA turnover protein 4